MTKTIRATEFLQIPATSLPGAYAAFGSEEMGPLVAWAEIRQMAQTGEPSIYDLRVSSSEWTGLRRVVAS